MKSIVKYEPMIEIKTFSWKFYYIKAEKYDAFMQECENCKFVRIWESHIAVSAIDTMDPAPNEISLVDKMTANLDFYLKIKIKSEVDRRLKEKLPVTEWVIRNMIGTFDNSSDIT